MSAREQAVHPVIRPLGPADIDAVLRIEELNYPFPWSRGIFEDCLRVGYACFGLQAGARLAGYSIHNRAAGECHLLNLCIHPDWQRQGFGGMLLEHAIAHAEALDSSVMYLEVRPSNASAARMYQRRGFRVVGKRPAYYRSEAGREDAIVMRLDLGGD